MTPETPVPTPVPVPERVPMRAKLAWALGSLGDNYASQGLVQLKDPVYNIALGVPANLLGLAFSVPRIIDAFVDPTIGYLSDNSKSPWGRRRPFILAGAIPLAILSCLLWLPGAGWSQQALLIYFTVATALYFLAYSLFIVPYRALGFELTTDYHERTRVQGWGMILGLLGGLGIPWLYKLALLFGGADPHALTVAPEVMMRGVRWVGLIVGGIILVACSAPALLCREKPIEQAGEKISVKAAVLETLRNRPFFIMLFARSVVLIGTFAVAALFTPLGIYYLFGGNQSAFSTLAGFAGNVLFAGALIGIPFNTWMSGRIGKRHAFIACLCTAIVGVLSQLLTLRPEHPYWLLPSNFILGFGLQGVWLMCQTMNADVCDEDELRTGRRREGIYGATYALMEKIGIGLGFAAGGYLAAACGYLTGVPAPVVLEKLRLALIWTPAIGMALGILLIWRYPLTHARMNAIRASLDARKARP